MKTAIGILAAIIITAGLALVWYYLKPKKRTREQFAIIAAPEIVALVGIGIAAVNSKEGITDQILSIIRGVFELPQVTADAAPLSEKMLVVTMVCFAIWSIYRCHTNWRGLISVDEEDRRREQRSISLHIQAYIEAKRLYNLEDPKVARPVEFRSDPVKLPESPAMVLSEHLRDLVHLYLGNSRFSKAEWLPQYKSWVAEASDKGMTGFLFCFREKPSIDEYNRCLEIIHERAKNGNYSAIIVFCESNGIYFKEAMNEQSNKIRIISEEFLVQNIVDFSDYIFAIKQRIDVQKFPTTNLSVSDIYVEPTLQQSEDQITSSELGTYLNDWSSQPPGLNIGIFGEYGQGKSTSALMFTYSLIARHTQDKFLRIPILIELRGRSPANLAPVEMLAAWGQQYNIQAGALIKLLHAGRLIIVFEGFDEMAHISTPELRISHFRSLWRFALPNSKLIFTGRKNFFANSDELSVAFRNGSSLERTTNTALVNLNRFDSAQIARSLRWVDPTIAKEILLAAAKNRQLFDILSRPSLLFIVANLWAELRPSLLGVNITSALVIGHFIEHSYRRQALKEDDLTFMLLTTTERRYFHEGIAIYMINNGTPNLLSADEMRAAVERLYRSYPGNEHVSEEILAETGAKPLKMRHPVLKDTIDLITTDLRTHGILINEVASKSSFRFAHKSFYEFLVAKVHAHTIFGQSPDFYNSIAGAMDHNVQHAYKSSESVRFFSELLIGSIEKNGLADSAFDEIFDIVFETYSFNKVLRKIMRVLNAAIVKTIREPILRFAFFFSVPASSIATIVLQYSDAGRKILISEPVLQIFFGNVSPDSNLSPLIIFSWISYIWLILYGTYAYRKLLTRSKRWATVLMYADKVSPTLRSSDGLIKVLGRKRTLALIESVSTPN